MPWDTYFSSWEKLYDLKLYDIGLSELSNIQLLKAFSLLSAYFQYLKLWAMLFCLVFFVLFLFYFLQFCLLPWCVSEPSGGMRCSASSDLYWQPEVANQKCVSYPMQNHSCVWNLFWYNLDKKELLKAIYKINIEGALKHQWGTEVRYTSYTSGLSEAWVTVVCSYSGQGAQWQLDLSPVLTP